MICLMQKLVAGALIASALARKSVMIRYAVSIRYFQIAAQKVTQYPVIAKSTLFRLADTV